MRRAIFACVGVVVLCWTTRAADVTFGAKLGLNLAEVDVEQVGVSDSDLSAKFGVTIGCAVDIAMSDMITVQTGLQYAMKGCEQDLPGGSGEGTLDFIEIPAVAKFNLAGGKAYAAAGINLGFVSKAKSEVGSQTIDFKDDLQGPNVDLVVAGGVALMDGKLTVGVQYELGLTDLADWSAAEVAAGAASELKSRNLQVVVAYTF